MDDNLNIPKINLEENQVMEMKATPASEPGFEQIKPKTTEPAKTDAKPNEVSTEMKNKESEHKKKSRFGNFFSPNRKKLFIRLGGVFAVLLLLFIAIGVLPAIDVYNKAKVIQAQVPQIQAAIDSQDIAQVKDQMSKLKSNLTALQGPFKRLSWTQVLPIVGKYWTDGDAGIQAGLYGIDAGEILVETVEPYADIIGFAGGAPQAANGEESANDRIEFLIQTLEDIVPKADEISEKARLANEQLVKIDANDYPEQFRGMAVREKLKKGLDLAEQATQMIANGKPLLEAAPYLLGNDSPRTYLLLFQNDKELRPTGGFLTAYSIVSVNKGKLNPVSSSDIYSLDAKYTPNIDAPQPYIDYLAGPYKLSPKMFLRDMNWAPDFEQSMDLFTTEAAKAGVKDIDGVIAVDTNVLVKILDVLGQIGVPGFGNFSTENDPRCDCPQVIYELESFADVEGPVVWSENEPGKIVYAPANYGKNRKEIVGPLMNSILSNALGQPKEKLPDLMQAGLESVFEKHILMYMFDDKYEDAVRSFNIAGTINDYEGDYLHVNNANLGGRKSNLYVTHEVDQQYEIKSDGSIEKLITITYKNPQTQDGWLNSVLPNWTRIYVPEGSELIETEGFEIKQDPYVEFGKTVFAGGFKLRPEGLAKIAVRYKLPFKSTGDLKLLIQKQPGTQMPLYTIQAGRSHEELFLLTDKEFKFKI